MKVKITLIAAIIFAALQTTAQIPNNGFENWTNKGLFDEPNGWASFNSICPTTFHSCTKSTDHYPVNVGSYSVRLENNTSLTQATGSYGLMTSDLTISYPFKPSFPVTGHPNSLTGYYKYVPQNFDSLTMSAFLFKNGVLVSNASFDRINMVSNQWVSFIINFKTYTEADSATIMFIAFTPMGPSAPPNGNSVLYIDNLKFDALISGQKEIASTLPNINIYPNPATDELNVNFQGKNEPLEFVVLNSVGQEFVSGIITENSRFDISALPSGFYFISIKMYEGTLVKKVMKE